MITINPIRVAFLDPGANCTCGVPIHRSSCAKATGLDLFGHAKEIQERYGKDVFATAVNQALDVYESQMRKGVVYYDTRQIDPPIILHDRAALLQAFYRDGQIGRPA